MLGMTPEAQAQPQFDRKIAKVLADKAAAALGELRGGFAMDQAPDFMEMRRAEGIEPVVPDLDETRTAGLAPPPVFPRTDIRVVYFD